MGFVHTPLERTLGRKTMLVLSCAVLGVAAVGFAIGIRGDQNTTALRPRHARHDASSLEAELNAAPPAPTYAEIATTPLGPNRNFVSSIATLKQAALCDPPKKPDPALRHLALARREARRAFDGAPPVVPHPVDVKSAASCLTCHENGMVVGDVIARKIPHPVWSQCLQCHVEQKSSRFADLIVAENSFDGMKPIEFAHRAGAGLPPWTPHATFLRHDCLACHGPTGDIGLKTSHPERANCLQCHPPSIALEFESPVETRSFLDPPLVLESSSGKSP